MRKILLLSLFILTTFLLSAQSVSKSTSNFLDQYRVYKNEVPNLAVTDFFSTNAIEMGLSTDDEMVIMKSEEGKNGYEHFRYKHLYKGIPVYGSEYLIHTKDGYVKSANGSYLPKINIDTNPAISAEEALTIAMNEMEAEVYAWEDETKNRGDRPTPELVVIDRSVPKITGAYRLAYQVEVRSTKPYKAMTYFVDANSSDIIYEVTEHHSHAVPGSGKTKYLGEQSFIVDSLAPDEYVLRDITRSTTGIVVYNEQPGEVFTSTTPFFDLENENLDEVAVDAHYLTSEYYDILRDEFDWLGLDNNDRAMEVIIHEGGGADLINAFWDGDFAHFGDGDCNHGPLVTAEVVTHEFMHGIIDFTSRLIYSDESGAINESLCDVMGQYIEYVLDEDNFSWDLGSSFHLTDGLDPFRVMNDPHEAGDPEFYQGDLWIDGAGVHTNSSVGNLMYVILSDGRTGENQLGEPFSVDPIGIEDAAKFLFYVNRMYLNPSSGYREFSEVSLVAAEEFFGGDQDIIDNLTEAWKAVGLLRDPIGGGNDDVFDLTIASETETVTCDWEEFATVVLNISNVGDLPYLAVNEGSVVIRNNQTGLVEDYLLTEDILPGESYELIVDDLIVRNSNFDIYVYQLFVDDESNGNEDTDIFRTTEFGENNVSFFTAPTAGECFATERELDMAIINESCTMLPAGTQMILRIINESDGSTAYNEILSTPNDLGRNGSWTFTRSFEVLESSDFEAILTFIGDQDPDDNTDFFRVSVRETIDDEYFNGFDSQANLSDKIEVSAIGFGDNLYRHLGDTRFMATGFFDEAGGPLCFQPEDNWNFDAGNIFGAVSAEISTCLDLEDMPGPKVVFDLIQYRNDFSDFAAEESSSMRVVWENQGVEVEQVIQGQEEGESENYTIPLPANYKGPLSLQFLTHTGTDENAANFLTLDVLLMNNLVIFNDGVNTLDEDDLKQLNVYPNPTSDELFLESSEVIDSYTIFDLNGKLLLNKTNQNERLITIDLEGFESGFYNLVVQDQLGSQVYRKFVKID